MRQAVVLFSGGQDSTTCLYWAKHHFDKVMALGFYYGQSHSMETHQASRIAQEADIPYELVDLSGVFSNSALLDPQKSPNAPHQRDQNLPATFTAGRNAVFLSVAAGVAYNEGAKHLVTGVCETDYSGYPDCREDFIRSQEQTIKLALDDDEMRIHAPLMHLTKAQTWKMAKDHGCLEVVRTMTLTDYNGSTDWNEWGMGRLDNPASKLRAKGYDEAKKQGWI